MIDYTAIKDWLALPGHPVDDAEIYHGLQSLLVKMNFLDATLIIAIVAFSSDTYSLPSCVELIQDTQSAMAARIKGLAGIAQRGTEAKFGYFRIMIFHPSKLAQAEDIKRAILGMMTGLGGPGSAAN